MLGHAFSESDLLQVAEQCTARINQEDVIHRVPIFQTFELVF